jgi:Leucine-rich repeat (LRR) protein
LQRRIAGENGPFPCKAAIDAFTRVGYTIILILVNRYKGLRPGHGGRYGRAAGREGRMKNGYSNNNMNSYFRVFLPILIFSCLFLYTVCADNNEDGNTNSTAESRESFITIGGGKEQWEINSVDSVYTISLTINPRARNGRTSFEGIELFKNIKDLTIYGLYLDEADYSPLAMLESLEILRIKGSAFSVNKAEQLFTDFSVFPRLDSVKYLQINYHALSSLNGIENFVNLEWLNLHSPYGNAFSDIPSYIPPSIESLKPLAMLEKLASIAIWDIGSSEFMVSDLSGMDTLETIEIFSMYKSFDFTGIADLINLRELSIDIGTRTINIEAIEELKNLKFLGIPVQSHVESLDFLTNLVSLETLNLFNASYPEGIHVKTAMEDDRYEKRLIDVSIFGNLQNLKKMYIEGFDIMNLKELDKMPNLELVVAYYSRFTPPEDNVLQNAGLATNPYDR